jgi:hypothetical protein
MVHNVLTQRATFDSDELHAGDYYYIKTGNDLAELGVALCR